MSKKYDYIIVGAGLYGSIFGYEMNKKGKKCFIIEKRNHIGGNCFTETIKGISVHKYGAHIFHTNDKKIWDYVNSFVEFNRYTNSPLAFFKGKLYNLPFNMNTFYQIWGVKTPEEAQQKIKTQQEEIIGNPKNLEEQAISLVGRDVYEILIKGYTEKQWGRKCADLPPFIIKRLPVRFTFDNNYFNDKYQGIPIGGYTILFQKWLEGIDISLNTDYFSQKEYFDSLGDTLVYTGALDQFYNFQYGTLEYRGLRFETSLLQIPNFQGNAVVNYTEKEVPYTRIIEHKHFEFGEQKETIITKEYPCEWKHGYDPYYPINDEKNQQIFYKYKKLAEAEKNVLFGGRLAEYKYYDMHQVIASALKTVQDESKNQ